MRQALDLPTRDSEVPALRLETGTTTSRASCDTLALPSICELVRKSRVPPAFQRVTRRCAWPGARPCSELEEEPLVGYLPHDQVTTHMYASRYIVSESRRRGLIHCSARPLGAACL